MGAKVRLSEKEAIKLGLIPDPKLVNKIANPEPYRVEEDHDWTTGPSVDSDGRFIADEFRVPYTEEGSDPVAASDFLTAIFIMIGWVVGFVMGAVWSAPR